MLREVGPCDLTTLVVAMLERGYVPVGGANVMRKSLYNAMRKTPSFKESKGNVDICDAIGIIDATESVDH